MIDTRAFFPAEAHISQNPVLMVVKVDLACRWEESMGQFSGDAVETMVQVGLQAVCVVDGIEACQYRERHIPQRRGGDPLSPGFLLCVQYSLEMINYKEQDFFFQPSTHRMTTIFLTVTENLCRTLELAPKGTDKA